MSPRHILVASLALAATTLASAGPVSTLYLNSETSRRLYAIQGDSIKARSDLLQPLRGPDRGGW